jgi:transcriptional regulator of heat shock response
MKYQTLTWMKMTMIQFILPMHLFFFYSKSSVTLHVICYYVWYKRNQNLELSQNTTHTSSTQTTLVVQTYILSGPTFTHFGIIGIKSVRYTRISPTFILYHSRIALTP